MSLNEQFGKIFDVKLIVKKIMKKANEITTTVDPDTPNDIRKSQFASNAISQNWDVLNQNYLNGRNTFPNCR